MVLRRPVAHVHEGERVRVVEYYKAEQRDREQDRQRGPEEEGYADQNKDLRELVRHLKVVTAVSRQVRLPRLRAGLVAPLTAEAARCLIVAVHNDSHEPVREKDYDRHQRQAQLVGDDQRADFIEVFCA